MPTAALLQAAQALQVQAEAALADINKLMAVAKQATGVLSCQPVLPLLLLLLLPGRLPVAVVRVVRCCRPTIHSYIPAGLHPSAPCSRGAVCSRRCRGGGPGSGSRRGRRGGRGGGG